MIEINSGSLNAIQKEFAEHIGLLTGDNGCKVVTEKSEYLSIEKKENEIKIGYSEKCEIFRALALLKGDLKNGETIRQKRFFDSLAAFCDCSRNAVMTVTTLKSFIMDIAALGYDTLYLYTEDTFEIEDEPYFGHMRGRYSADEIRELDRFAGEFGIELIPAVQTLAHLNGIFHWNIYDGIRDCNDILLCDEEKTYNLIERMVASLRSMYSTDKINIGMDEAHNLGLGKYLDNNGYSDKMDIFLRHINRVVEILKKYGFKPMMWSDMFFKIATGKCTYDQLDVIDFKEDVIKLLPQDITLTYWNYSPRESEYYDSIFKAHLKMKCNIMFAGGFRKWVGICPNLTFSFEASRTALDSAERNGIRNVIITGWGDDGAEGALYLMLPGLVLFAEKCYLNDMSDETVNSKLTTLFGYSLEEFKTAELPNLLPEPDGKEISYGANTAKILLWNDPLLGQYDRHIPNGSADYYIHLTEQLKNLKDRENRFAYVFETVYCLCDLLCNKAELGNKLRAAYQNKDIAALKALESEVRVCIEKLRILHGTFRKNWRRENKIFGFDVQDIRFGAMQARLEYAESILEEYLTGKTDCIPELEIEPLYMDCRNGKEEKNLSSFCNSWKRIATVSVL